MGSVGASQRSASLFEQLRERESAWIGQLSFSLPTKVFLLESQVVKPEERHGFFVRGALAEEEEEKRRQQPASGSLLSIKH